MAETKNGKEAHEKKVRAAHKNCMAESLKRLKKNGTRNLPATSTQVHSIETEFNVQLPFELKELLLRADGCTGPDGEQLLWTTEKIISENVRLRTDPVLSSSYMPFKDLLFFSGNNGEKLFAFPIPENVAEQNVFQWNPKTDSRTRVAGCLDDFYMRFFEKADSSWKCSFRDDHEEDPGDWLNVDSESLKTLLLKHCELTAPIKEDRIREFEKELGMALPEALRALYKISDGVKAFWGVPLIYSLEELKQSILKTRSEDCLDFYMPVDTLFFFGEEGNGDRYAFRILNGKLDAKVFEWDHECDERRLFAPDLITFLELEMTMNYDDYEEEEEEEEND